MTSLLLSTACLGGHRARTQESLHRFAGEIESLRRGLIRAPAWRVAAAVAVAGLLPLSEGSAQSGGVLGLVRDTHTLSKLANFATLLIVSGFKEQAIAGTRIRFGIRLILAFDNRNLSTQSLQPAGNPNASGSGTNVSRDGGTVVGFQDSGFFTPFHAFRWTQATGPVDLGSLDPANNGNLSSSAMDVSDGGSVVVGVSQVTETLTPVDQAGDLAGLALHAGGDDERPAPAIGDGRARKGPVGPPKLGGW